MENYGSILLSRPIPKGIPTSWITVVPGKARDFISALNITLGMRVILFLRVSSHKQEKKRNLDDQERRLRRLVEEAGGIVVDVIRVVGSGWADWYWPWIADRARNDGAVVLAESTDRFVRSRLYHSEKRWFVRATLPQLEELSRAFFGVTLMTVADPDAPAQDVRSEQTKRGKAAKGNPGGRPRKVVAGYKKERRLEKLPLARQLKLDGLCVKEICKQVGIARRTFYNWMAED